LLNPLVELANQRTEKAVITAAVPIATRDKLIRHAEEGERSVSSVIRIALNRYLEDDRKEAK
jgi:hypothetical protein